MLRRFGTAGRRYPDVLLWMLLAALLPGPWVQGAQAGVTLHRLFGDNMVLQRDAGVPVWGRAAPGETVTVRIDNLEASATADTGGVWMARLDPHAAGGPFDMTVTGTDTVRVRNILFGDVWLCGGQSNMEFHTSGVTDAARDMAAAHDPAIRHFFVSHRDLIAPVSELREGRWDVCSPTAVGNFTAVGYFFARELRRQVDVPIGLINSSVGGTKAEKWIGRHALARIPELQFLLDDYAAAQAAFERDLAIYQAEIVKDKQRVAEAQAQRKKLPPVPKPPKNYPGPGPSSLYNGMVAPLMPFAIRGVIWYQGESNADHPDLYRTLFPLLITSWREDWGADFPFLFVQLANYEPHDETTGQWAELRAAQESALAVPGTAMALAIDVGESHDIHPKNKQEVGRRLALAAEAKVYGLPVESSGPVVREVKRDGHAVRVTFDHGDGLSFTGTALNAFELAGEDGEYRPAQARIAGNAVMVSRPDIRAPLRIRYGWADDPPCNLYNAARLPARPFRADLPR
jgi:sialate O-acetylesterase